MKLMYDASPDMYYTTIFVYQKMRLLIRGEEEERAS